MEQKLISFVKEVWNVILNENQAKDILEKYPDIYKEYNTQKSLFGFNMFCLGHSSPKYFNNGNNI